MDKDAPKKDCVTCRFSGPDEEYSVVCWNDGSVAYRTDIFEGDVCEHWEPSDATGPGGIEVVLRGDTTVHTSELREDVYDDLVRIVPKDPGKPMGNRIKVVMTVGNYTAQAKCSCGGEGEFEMRGGQSWECPSCGNALNVIGVGGGEGDDGGT